MIVALLSDLIRSQVPSLVSPPFTRRPSAQRARPLLDSLPSDLGRALRPEQPYAFQPGVELLSKPARPSVFNGSDLGRKTTRSKQRNRFFSLRHKAAIRKPHE